MPREKPDTGSSARSSRPARSSAARPTRGDIGQAVELARRTSRFSRAVSSGYRRDRARACRCGRGSGAGLARPCGRRTRRARTTAPPAWPRMASSVDLPAPFGPSRPRISPASQRERDLGERLAAPEVPGQSTTVRLSKIVRHAAEALVAGSLGDESGLGRGRAPGPRLIEPAAVDGASRRGVRRCWRRLRSSATSSRISRSRRRLRACACADLSGRPASSRTTGRSPHQEARPTTA